MAVKFKISKVSFISANPVHHKAVSVMNKRKPHPFDKALFCSSYCKAESKPVFVIAPHFPRRRFLRKFPCYIHNDTHVWPCENSYWKDHALLFNIKSNFISKRMIRLAEEVNGFPDSLELHQEAISGFPRKTFRP